MKRKGARCFKRSPLPIMVFAASALHTTPKPTVSGASAPSAGAVPHPPGDPVVSEQHNDWSEHLQLVAMSLRSAHERVIGMSPFEAMFATPMHFPPGPTTYAADNDASARSGHVGDRVVALLRSFRGVFRARRPGHEVAHAFQAPHGEGLQPTHGPTRDTLRRE